MTQFAFVFPGQGSQTVGMLADMAASYPIVEETFAEASAALGYDLWALTQQGPAEELNKTWQTQPALLTASVALYRVWQQQGGKAPAMMAGHSLGEYSALVCAGVIDFADAVRLVEMRGKFMQEAVPEGTGADMAASYPIVEETFAEASAALGYDLWALTQQGPAEELNKTWQTQPALLTASVALYRVWQQQGGKAPAMMAGHSLGEYSALVCAGVIDFADAVRLVEMRGKFMQEAVPEGTGAMAAIIGLDDASIAKACEEAAEGQVVSPVNFNSPGQVVIAGHKEAVERAGAACKAAGAKRALPLPVSVPSHCALMKPAADKLAVELAKITFNAPTVPVVNNVDVKCETNGDAIRDALVRQLYNPVQWTKSVEYMAAQGVEHLYEVGPGKVLTGLTKRIVDTLTASALNEPSAMAAALEL